ncbi:hypothetical protein [Lysinibacillus sp. NPDC056232]|uniref:hypothetical protein n=1 Tax=Lysinibacillus sp. NPDC056232 TaxID=3345756 RepID=UPI0035DA9E53
MDFNIYKIFIDREEFINILREKGMERKGERITHDSKLIINNESVDQFEIEIDFFFKLSGEESVEIDWFNYWSSIFDSIQKETKIIESAYGMIILSIHQSVYAISLGRGHSYANSYSDMDFGFDVAEIIHDEESVEVKGSKFFKQTKSKSLTQYNSNSIVVSEIGESHEFLISKIKMKEKYKHFHLFSYEKKIKFSNSVKVESDSYQPLQIIKIVHELHYIYENEDRLGNLPRMIIIKDTEDNAPMLSDLNNRLLTAIKSNNESVSIAYFIEENGDMIVNPFSDEEVALVYDRKTYPLTSYSIDAISKVLSDINCTDITKASIRNLTDKETVKIIKLLDFTTKYRGEKDYSLYKGKWASFNTSYINFIEQQINRVNEVTFYNPPYNLTQDKIISGREIQIRNTEKYDQKPSYAEYPYNIYLENKYGFILLDRKREHPSYKFVEFADLYDSSTKSLIHVKIGDTTSLRYCIQQSLHSTQIFNTKRDVLEVYEVDEVTIVSMLFVLKSTSIICDDERIDFSKNNSVYFKIELIEWLNTVQSLGYQPQIIIAIDSRGTSSEENTEELVTENT